MVRTVNRQGSKAIDELCARGDQLLGEENNPLRDVWHQDVVERLEYEKDQHKAGAVHHPHSFMYIDWVVLYSNIQQSQQVECCYSEIG